MGTIAYLSLGSNLGDKVDNLQQALAKIDQDAGTILSISNFYASEPWGFQTTNQFLNICISLETTLTPDALLSLFQQIESHIGRTKHESEGYESRIIDIDILTFGQLQIETDNLIIPHPEIENRNFVLIPLREIAPNFTHPKTAKSIKQIIAACTDETSVVIYESK